MKRNITYITAILSLVACLLPGCRVKEDDFVIDGEPRFSVTIKSYEMVKDGNKDVEKETVEVENATSVQYAMELGSDAYSAAFATTSHVGKATRFHLNTNMKWKVVPAGDESYDWIYPFPDSGEKEGVFFFKSTRNISLTEQREAYFNLLVDRGSGYEPVEGMITVKQVASAPFIELSDAKFSAGATAQNLKLRVLANVDWTYELQPMEDYGTADIQWITDNSAHEATKQIDTLKFRLAANEGGLRGANIIISYTQDGAQKKELIPITQYPAVEAELEGFPVKWQVRINPNTYAATFPANGTIEPVSGNGYIHYNNAAGLSADSAGKCLLDVSDNSPRVTGPWPGDYCEFVASTPVSAGTIIKLTFATRVSKTGPKHWRLEFRDGEQWKVAGKELSDPAAKGAGDELVRYTHTMADDGSTNIKVEGVALYENNTDQVEFRFICASREQASGAGPLAAPNGGTWRLSVDSSNNADDEFQPTISCIAAGTETLKPAALVVKESYLLFNGLKPAQKVLHISSDQDVTLSSEQGWIHFEKATAEAAESIEMAVTVDESKSSENREGLIVVKSGITRKEIPVIQGAAGQELDPFVSLASGNVLKVDADQGKADVKVQANVEVSFETADAWINVAPAETKAMVEWTNFVVSYEANESEAPRTGTIRFFNEEKNVEAVLTVEQAGKEVILDNTLIQWGFDATLMDQYKDAFEKDNAFKANIAGSGVLSWHNLPENVAADTGNKKSQVIGGTGQPYVTGAWPGDYWLFTFPVKDVAKGSVISFSALSKVSGTGHRFWRMDYSIDGNNWYPAAELKTETLTGTEAKYTHEFATTSDTKVEASITAPIAIPEATVQIRFTCVANWQQKGGALAAPNGGTHRWAGGKDDGPKITIAEPEPPVSALPIKWSFGDPSALTAGVDYGITWPNVYLYADDGVSRLDLVRPGERSAPTTLTFSTEGNFTRILSTGVGLGDYWLFTLPVKDQQAGTYSISYKATSSNAGPKFFLLEYSLDQTTWYPIQAQKGTFQVKDKPETAREVTYTYMISGNNVTCEVNASMKAPALSGRQVIYVRARVSDNLCCNLSKELNGLEHGGTTRIGGGIDITFTAD